ncbi:MAG: M12 family metallo-peptidase [Verrucomicrobiota bacterium]|nr:M12 family metallo-peptidase [Verrucomicrobiota bacterium]
MFGLTQFSLLFLLLNGFLMHHLFGSQTGMTCLTEPFQTFDNGLERQTEHSPFQTIKIFRIAAAASGEFTAYHGGKEAALKEVLTALKRASDIFEREAGVRLQPITNIADLIFIDSRTDPFSANDASMTTIHEAQDTFDAIVGNANYDLGILFNTGLYGLAYIRSVCDPMTKGSAVIGLPNPSGDAFHVNFVIHEIAHQFGANHTFNSPSGLCAERRNPWTAFEPGAGSTIMSYASVPCQPDHFQTGHDPYFHSESISEIRAFIKSPSASCAMTITSSNRIPTVQAGGEYFIPVGTPFELTAIASDPDGDPLTYCWEERDLGPAQMLSDPDNGQSPLFRSRPPSVNSTRVFPMLPLPSGENRTLEDRLPTTDRTLRFRVTVRDNQNNGALAWADTRIFVTNVAGAFRVIVPTGTVQLEEVVPVQWEVAGTAGPPFNAGQVTILLSTNSGLTFDYVLSAATANDGYEIVRIPALNSSAARIKVKPLGQVFFAINDSDLQISSAGYHLSVTELDSGSFQLSWYGSAGQVSHLQKRELPHGTWGTILSITNQVSTTNRVALDFDFSGKGYLYRIVQ